MTLFLVTGSGRCGTQWMARVLTNLGYRCGHESVFNPATIADGSWSHRLSRPDSSWLALAVLDQIPADVAIIAVIRNPLAVIRSLVGIGFFDAETDYSRAARQMFALPDDPLEASAWFWIEANRRALTRAAVVARIESPDLRAVVDCIHPGNVISDRRIASVVRNLGPMNSRDRDESITLDMLQSATRNALRDVAAMAGYEA